MGTGAELLVWARGAARGGTDQACRPGLGCGGCSSGGSGGGGWGTTDEGSCCCRNRDLGPEVLESQPHGRHAEMTVSELGL